MKPIKLLVLFALVLAPAVASADYYNGGGGGYGGPRFHHRMGRLAWGFSVGIGGMHDDGSGLTDCAGCASAFAFEADAHIGGMLTNNFALLFEGQVNGRTVAYDNGTGNGDTVLTQNVALIAGQWWVLPMLWVKVGLGVADLSKNNDYVSYDYGTGGAVMGAVGFEAFSSRFFAIDIQARIVDGIYDSFNDHITSGTFGVGFNWY
jgi:hypothetical protein